jgi:NADP-dependent aldehyde dehydrogenase
VSTVPSHDPRTGAAVHTALVESSADDVAAACERAAQVAPALDRLGRLGRADLLEAMAEAVEERRAELVAAADAETALGPQRLGGELTRTCFQLRLFADVLRDGGYLEATIDHAGPTPMGPRPDLRRMLVPTGPVAVFGASNFPFAFSVPGGDTASALAAGCPVVVKAHPSHPRTSQLAFEALAEGLARAGAPDATVQLVHGEEAGRALVADPHVTAVAFTGSLRGGQALMDLVNRRDKPIPFYGELSSLNPVVVTPAAARERAGEIGAGLVGSFTLGAGQFCTKPGLVLLPAGPDGDAVVDAMRAAVAGAATAHALNAGIADGYAAGVDALVASSSATLVQAGLPGDGTGYEVRPALLAADELTPELTHEVFGPMAVVVRYASPGQLLGQLSALPASLTTSVHAGTDEVDLPRTVVDALTDRTGRFVFDGHPTGVAVAWAQHHGGLWPSTNSAHTSVGPTSVRRFLRPIAFQDAPAHLLPDELLDATTSVPRRVDGVQVAAGPAAGQPVASSAALSRG